MPQAMTGDAAAVQPGLDQAQERGFEPVARQLAHAVVGSDLSQHTGLPSIAQARRLRGAPVDRDPVGVICASVMPR